ncbi:hypothetical protein DSO57_1028072 [Entomophthora muscae]|uniref:Uncharacterized protein n=1 Tax=Entomophthora muscae TaxID=34485 RepID=A0ACC2S3C9_9FUNG|nr:hypothetical protein DSO57_1028072 [Entomophthora muscae]
MFGRAHKYEDNNYIPINGTKLSRYSGYATVGWTKPKKYPEPDNDSFWLNQVSPGDYTINQASEMSCFSKNSGHDLTRTCLKPIESSFWWGDTVNISKLMSCITETYQFSLTSPILGFSRTLQTNLKDGDLQVYPDLSPPPKPWILYDQIYSNVVLNGTMRGLRSGYFWVKPLYWATVYAGYKTTTIGSTIVSRYFKATQIYPVSRNGRIEGLYGFKTASSRAKDYIDPARFDFYPLS